MQISLNDWVRFRKAMEKINKKAAEEFRDHFFKGEGKTGLKGVSIQEVIEYAYALATKYGEASAELAAQMYDAIAEAEGVQVLAAEVAETATYQETARAINGSLKQSPSGQLLDQVTSRLVKQAAADTMIKNALRDGAEFAWITQGDTCAFCRTLSSRGWQQASKKAIRNGHAEHIHANCDCMYCVRHKSNTNVRGYDPEKLKREYDNAAPGKSPQEKINAMRRESYSENRERINEQKRAAYAKRIEANKGDFGIQ